MSYSESPTREQGIGIITNAFQQVVERNQHRVMDRTFLNRLRVEMDLALMNTGIDSSWYRIHTHQTDQSRIDITITPPTPLTAFNIDLGSTITTTDNTGEWQRQVNETIEQNRDRADALSGAFNDASPLMVAQEARDEATRLFPMSGTERRRELQIIRANNYEFWADVVICLRELDHPGSTIASNTFGGRVYRMSDTQNDEKKYSQAEVDKMIADALKDTINIKQVPIEEEHRSIKL